MKGKKTAQQKKQNRNDLLLAAALILSALLGLGVYRLISQEGGRAVVYLDGECQGSYPLSENIQIDIGGTNRLIIQDGKADMLWADCPDQLCVRQPAVCREGESIVCLPNRVVVAVEGRGGVKIDAQAY